MSFIKRISYLLLFGLVFNFGYASTIKKSSKEEKCLNITEFGTLCYWNSTNNALGNEVSELRSLHKYDGIDNVGVRWWDARDIHSFEVLCNSQVSEDIAASMQVEYWHNTWPDNPPQMPSYEDEEDDMWQGKWITAKTDTEIQGNRIIYKFKPLEKDEIPTADHLPGQITYRRTLKMRVKYPQQYQSLIKNIAVYSMATLKEENIRIEFLQEEKSVKNISGEIEVFNGSLVGLSGWNWKDGDEKKGKNGWDITTIGNGKGINIKALTANALLPGSNEETVITVRSNNGTFSFSTADLLTAPMYIPDFNVYIAPADNPVNFNKNIVKGANIRKQIMLEPEQSYERASKEIPAKDPIWDQSGRRIYLPLACDASWQKFAVEWGGNLIIDKHRANVRGKALDLCKWNGGELNWNFGTGENPNYQRTQENCRMSVLHNYLPVVSTNWNHEGLLFEEEAFVTSSENSTLSPFNSGRDEFSPTVLMVKLRISNPSLNSKQSHIWLQGNGALTEISSENGFIYDKIDGEKYLRSYTQNTVGERLKTSLFSDKNVHGIHYDFELGAGISETFYFYFPFIGNLTSADMALFTTLDYSKERARVVDYWRDLVAENTVFNVPEEVFNRMSKSVIPHIRMSVIKDPESGLYVVPAASFNYPVYANESIFQTVLLDRLGDSETVRHYLETFLQLQGSSKLPGAYTGNQEAVFHGVKISETNDYTALGYNMNHGTVLWGLAHYYTHSKDKAWLEKAAPQLMKAADWIIEQRKQTQIDNGNGNPVLHYGLLPAGMLEDCYEWRYWYATNAYSYLGLKSLAEAFSEAGLPQAEHYLKEAESYCDDIRKSLQWAMELSPVVRLRNNICVPYVPVHPYQRFRYFGAKKSKYYDRYQKGIYPTLRLSSTREVLYGPVTLLKTGIIDAKSTMADWILNDWEDNLTLSTSMNLNTHGWVDDEYWFSRGGMVFQACLQNPISAYLDRHETKAAIRSLYNNFTSLFYPDVVAFSEEYRMWKHGSGPFYKTPDEARFVSQVIDLLIEEKDDEIWLGNGIPQQWLEAGKRVELNKVHTRYGEVSYSLSYSKDSHSIEAEILKPDNNTRILLFVRAPFEKAIQSVIVNNQVWTEWDADKQMIVLPQGEKSIQLIVNYKIGLPSVPLRTDTWKGITE
ncbi:hypothetical protein [uncultured Dysgonomonas sp.]|nr:hypothetical protein [uncultured Dysgonomonas sp.]